MSFYETMVSLIESDALLRASTSLNPGRRRFILSDSDVYLDTL